MASSTRVSMSGDCVVLYNINKTVMQEITNKNSQGEYHGYQQGCLNYLNELTYRGTYKRHAAIGYHEYHGMEETYYYVR